MCFFTALQASEISTFRPASLTTPSGFAAPTRRKEPPDDTEAARANYDATVATCRQSTLDAFQQVEDNLAALRLLERETETQAAAVRSSDRSLELSLNQYKGGLITCLDVVTAQTIALENERAAVDILRRRMDASVLLIKALGGGWTTAQLPKVTS